MSCSCELNLGNVKSKLQLSFPVAVPDVAEGEPGGGGGEGGGDQPAAEDAAAEKQAKPR